MRGLMKPPDSVHFVTLTRLICFVVTVVLLGR